MSHVTTNTGLYEGNASLLLVNLSAYLFLGRSGEPRLGSGCEAEQLLHYRCSERDVSGDCEFWSTPFEDKNRRLYLAMRCADSQLDTVMQIGDGDQYRTDLRNENGYHCFRTQFTLSRHERSGIRTMMVKNGTAPVSITTKSKAKIIPLHRKALANASCQTTDCKHCLRNPAPYFQQYGYHYNSTCWNKIMQEDFTIEVKNEKYWGSGCQDGHVFGDDTCAFGRLRKSYAIVPTNIRNTTCAS